MDYRSIFDPIPWAACGQAVIQTFVIFWLVMLGLKLVGRRVFGEMGPQDMLTLLLIAEACDVGLTPEDGGFWATVASVATILAVAGSVERITWLREWLESSPVVLVENGHADRRTMARFQVSQDDLDIAARQYGADSIDAFERMVIEGDGKITGVLKKGPQPGEPARA